MNIPVNRFSKRISPEHVRNKALFVYLDPEPVNSEERGKVYQLFLESDWNTPAAMQEAADPSLIHIVHPISPDDCDYLMGRILCEYEAAEIRARCWEAAKAIQQTVPPQEMISSCVEDDIGRAIRHRLKKVPK